MSDEEDQVNAKSHKQLLQAISTLGKSQHIRKPTRDEATHQQDEFHLVKETEVKKSQAVSVNDIVDALKDNKNHFNAGRQLKNVLTTKKVLEEPLHKPAAERIKRAIAYENVKKSLTRWDGIVARNRTAENQIFPLQKERIYLNSKSYNSSIKSDLQIQMEELENKYAEEKRERTKNEPEDKKIKMTKKELEAKRRELAYLKMRESQKSAKARLQNKIKSKKYHKLLKRQKIQEQIKEFELLQKTNPEAALEKLNALEKSRVMERASLRHKNTGTWAKNLQVRAKYDKDVRKDLSEQLQISRQLTEKTEINSDNDNENDEKQQMEMDVKAANLKEEDKDYDPFNPWTKIGNHTNTIATEAEQEDGNNWRKYWLERNDNEKLMADYKQSLQEEDEVTEDDKKQTISNHEKSIKEKKNNKLSKIKKTKSKTLKSIQLQENEINDEKNGLKRKKNKNKSLKFENGWLVEELIPPTNESIDDIFDAQEDLIKENLRKKLDIINKKAKLLKTAKKNATKKPLKKSEDALKNLKDLSFKNDQIRPIIDEELTNEMDDNKTINKEMKNILEKAKDVNEKPDKSDDSSNINNTIDPTKFAAIKLKQNPKGYDTINGLIDDVDMDDEDVIDAAEEQQMTIAQAFEDDDIVADFSRDKAKDSEIKNAELELSMPGWGSWAGPGITSKDKIPNRNKRLIFKPPPEEKRRDENKGGVWINENVSKKLRKHLVSEIPFPFTSVKDFEASIRAPIGREWNTETSFRLLTRPSVITKKGTIIEPMDESDLFKKPRKPTNPVDIKIAEMSKSDKRTKMKFHQIKKNGNINRKAD